MRNIKLNTASACLVFSLFSSLLASVPAFAQGGNAACGSLANAFGPFDFRTERGEKLGMVEGAHFLPYVEALVRGKTSTTPGGDIDYTLRAFPNHHRALFAMMRLGEKEQTPKPKGSRYTVECWFERALQFRPDDTTVRIIYSTYLVKNKRTQDAVAHLEYATTIAKDNPFTHYNIGLVYFDMKIYDKAFAQAHKAMALGFTRPELRDLLEKAGQWKDPTIAPPDDLPAANPSDTPASAPQ